MTTSTQQTLAQFADDYMLTLKVKRAKDQSGAYTPAHVVYKVKIKSPILSGKLKTNYTAPRTGYIRIEDILSCLKLDGMMVHPDYAECQDAAEFAQTYYLNEFQQGIEVYNACQKQLAHLMEFFGEGGFEALVDCETL